MLSHSLPKGWFGNMNEMS